MQYSLLFRGPTKTTQTLAQTPEVREELFPYTAMYRYENNFLDLRHWHYGRRSIHLDHYAAHHDDNYTLDVETKSNAYILIALEHERLTYRTGQHGRNRLTFCSNECLLVYAEAGTYTVELGGVHNRLHTISLDPAFLYPLRDEFNELVSFMDTTRKTPLSSMRSCKMDQTFRYRLQRLTDMPFGRHKDFNRHLLWELSPLLSAYKGLLQGKDRHTQEQQLLESIYQYIEQQLTARQEVTVEQLCKNFPVSRRKLERLFSAHQNNSPTRYIRIKKMAIIGELLRSTDMPILELALLYGYSDSQSFNRIFRKEMGVSPARYRLQ